MVIRRRIIGSIVAMIRSILHPRAIENNNRNSYRYHKIENNPSI
jgi:hypothetical protein